MNKTNTLIVILIAVAVFLEGVHIFLSNRLAANSIFVESLKKESATLEEEDQSLTGRVLEKTSYEYISSRAAALGFVTQSNFISLYDPVQVAVQR